jgi:hypothetical protein
MAWALQETLAQASMLRSACESLRYFGRHSDLQS